MTHYAKVNNGSVVKFGLPSVGELSDGRTVSGYDKLPVDTLKNEGWLPVVDNGPPTYDSTTQEVIHNGYLVEADQVTAQYLVQDKPPPPPPDPDYDQQFINAVTAATTLDQLKAALIGNTGPGAKARRKVN